MGLFMNPKTSTQLLGKEEQGCNLEAAQQGSKTAGENSCSAFVQLLFNYIKLFVGLLLTSKLAF